MAGLRTAALAAGGTAWNGAANRHIGGEFLAARQIAARKNRVLLRRGSCDGAEEVVDPAIGCPGRQTNR